MWQSLLWSELCFFAIEVCFLLLLVDTLLHSNKLQVQVELHYS
uniref:Uncharacterized protein n=1 Tax=Arundo donax TaxID=35708 RepID=A0A0A8Z2X2_ARUDO